MTKRYAVPGLRLGYVTGAPHLLHRLRTNRMPWSVNQLAIEAGLHLLEHDVPNPLDVASYLQEAARLRSALEALGGLEVWATETHFMLVCLRMGRASALKDYLAGEHGILIRGFPLAPKSLKRTPYTLYLAAYTPPVTVIKSLRRCVYITPALRASPIEGNP